MLNDTITANESTPSAQFDAGILGLDLKGTAWSAGTVQVQRSYDNDTWVNLPDGSFSADTAKNIEHPGGHVRAVGTSITGVVQVLIYRQPEFRR